MSTALNAFDRIRAFWDQRAREYGADGRATLRETHLREVEVRTMMRKIRALSPLRVLDVGCGNGWSTRLYAQAFPQTQFVGIDFSEEMIRHAKYTNVSNCRFAVGNVLDATSLPGGSFDLVMTQRCLQNLPDWETQKQAIANLMGVRSPHGKMMLMECSKDGVAQLNALREEMGQEPLTNIEPWHNCFMKDEQLVREYGATVEYFSSTYMFLTKVLHKKLSYVARYLPPIGQFGYDRLYVIE
jgi:ubiquinone/menaquinone biosynthesis C-methylase UbiE